MYTKVGVMKLSLSFHLHLMLADFQKNYFTCTCTLGRKFAM